MRTRQTELFLVSPSKSLYKIKAYQILLDQGWNKMILIPQKIAFPIDINKLSSQITSHEPKTTMSALCLYSPKCSVALTTPTKAFSL